MGLFDIFRGKDPTEYWPQAASFQPVLDLRTMSFNSVRLGEAEETVKNLGKPDNPRPFKSGRYMYRRSGAEVAIGGNAVDYFAVILAPEGNYHGDKFQPTVGKIVRADGQCMGVSSATQIADLRTFLGEPSIIEQESDEILHTYALGKFVLEVEAMLDGFLKRINLFRA